MHTFSFSDSWMKNLHGPQIISNDLYLQATISITSCHIGKMSQCWKSHEWGIWLHVHQWHRVIIRTFLPLLALNIYPPCDIHLFLISPAVCFFLHWSTAITAKQGMSRLAWVCMSGFKTCAIWCSRVHAGACFCARLWFYSLLNCMQKYVPRPFAFVCI